MNNLTAPTPFSSRLTSIDAFRAVTLMLMIWVNDFWTLKGIPEWLGHAEAAEDRMGFSDVIFPAFLFIVGLSVPIAVRNRLQKGDTLGTLSKHILWRSLALLSMGFFHVNMGNYSGEVFSKPVWMILVTVSFFLIWLDYPKERKYTLVLQIAGVALLIILAAVYEGRSAEGTVWMQPKWWGILGLIGWSYLIVAFVFLLSDGKLIAQWLAFALFLFFNSATQLGWLDGLSGIKEYIWIIGDGSMPAMVMAGVITTLYYINSNGRYSRFLIFTAVFAVAMIAFGFATRPWFEISKIRATPSWVTICIGISVVCFAALAYITDVKGKKAWYNLIKPAGVSTLTCFLLPYIHSAILLMVAYRLPVELRTGVIGLSKSFVFALLIIGVVGMMQKWRIRLKL
ncbi:MAG TPA: DUF5009 domain-containing protein [Sphingobacteriaceae bacterium]